MARRMPLLFVLPLTVAAVLGCAAADTPPAETPAKQAPTTAPKAAAAPAAPAAPVDNAAPGHLARPMVERVLRQGPPWLLAQIVPEEVIRDGRFVGWRLLSLPASWNIDLKPGDVVTKVNGLSIETPDDFWAAWMQMQSAVELRVAYERGGKPLELVMPIDGPTSAGPLTSQDNPEPPPRAPSRWKTVVIGGDDAAPVDPVSE
ncbi:MAG: serine protease [Polyangiaceae bacterium]|nr:serine protease [Polyangiaceae bacterium]